MKHGEKVRAAKRFKAAGGKVYTPNVNSTRPGNRMRWSKDKYGMPCAPSWIPPVPQSCVPPKGPAPELNPETLTRQQVRAMTREKAKRDVFQQFGRAGEKSGEFVGYLGFARRNRRLVIHRQASRWYRQIAESSKNPEQSRKRGFIKEMFRKVLGAKENTLAAAGVGR